MVLIPPEIGIAPGRRPRLRALFESYPIPTHNRGNPRDRQPGLLATGGPTRPILFIRPPEEGESRNGCFEAITGNRHGRSPHKGRLWRFLPVRPGSRPPAIGGRTRTCITAKKPSQTPHLPCAGPICHGGGKRRLVFGGRPHGPATGVTPRWSPPQNVLK